MAAAEGAGPGNRGQAKMGVHGKDNKATKLHYRHYAGHAAQADRQRIARQATRMCSVAHFEWNSKFLALEHLHIEY